jgi:hypothetical protein
MKSLHAFALLVISAAAAAAQTNLWQNSGNIGIGTTSPISALTVKHASTYAPSLTSNASAIANFTAGAGGVDLAMGYDPSGLNAWWMQTRNNLADGYSYPLTLNPLGGNVGIGTTSPATKLEVSGAFRSTDEAGLPSSGRGIEISYQTSSDRGRIIAYDRSANLYKPLNLEASAYYFQNGNVGIGTTNPTEKLSVNGKIRAKEVIVDTGWSDYVFAKDYKLASLSEVEQHIQQQGHLPGVPSAAEVAEKGVSVGDMQAVLLAKIEELTLHQIAQEKELARLRENEKEVSALRAEVQQLRQAK